MHRRTAVLACLLVVCVALAGCGGGSGPTGSGGTRTIPFGPLMVGVDSTAGFTILPLLSPPSSSVNLTALYGSKIVRLSALGRGKIAFASHRDGNYEVYAMNADGSGQTDLTNNPATEFWPAWSPDGKKIAFSSLRDGDAEIYVMNANGSGQANLTNNAAANDQCPAWSLDGNRIAFTSDRDGNYEVYAMNANGSGQTNLTQNAGDDRFAAWSPDGRRIAFTSSRDGNDEIYVMNADGSAQTNLTHNAANESYPAWSPDGRRIAFTSTRDGNEEIYVMNADGSGPTNLTASGADDSEPAWSLDGKKITFTTTRDGAEEIYVMNADGSGPTNLTANGAFDFSPAWSPAPAIDRAFIGSAGTDGGANPPFGTQRPLVVVGLTDVDGVVSAATVSLPSADWPSLRATALDYRGGSLVGLGLTANQITTVIEDQGRGLPTRNWSLTGGAVAGAALVFFSGETGHVTSVIGGADAIFSASRKAAVESTGGRLVIHGPVTAALDARDPARNHLTRPAQQVVLDAKTGEVLSG